MGHCLSCRHRQKSLVIYILNNQLYTQEREKEFTLESSESGL